MKRLLQDLKEEVIILQALVHMSVVQQDQFHDQVHICEWCNYREDLDSHPSEYFKAVEDRGESKTCKYCNQPFYRDYRTNQGFGKAKFCSKSCASKSMRVHTTDDRRERIVNLREQGKTLQDIGSIFNITGERVRQILDK